MLEASSYIEDDSLKQGGDIVAGTCSWEWRVNNQAIPSRITWQDGIVQEIVLSVSYQLTVAEVIEKFGSPDAILASELGTHEHWYIAVDLYYPDQGLQFVAYTLEYSSIIEPDTRVGMAIYYFPETLEDRLLHEFSYISLTPEEILGKVKDIVRDWKGYGDLLVIYYESPNDMLIEK